MTESTHTGAKPQTPRICSKIAEELGLSSREGVIRDQSAKKIAKKPYCPHQRAQGDFLFQLELKLSVFGLLRQGLDFFIMIEDYLGTSG